MSALRKKRRDGEGENVCYKARYLLGDTELFNIDALTRIIQAVSCSRNKA
jgi:hypothetical protein